MQRNCHGFLVLTTSLSTLNMFKAFKACRDSIDMIVQCLDCEHRFTV